MNFYQTEIERIRKACYNNTTQIETVINTRNFIEMNFDKELNMNSLSHVQFRSKFHLIRLFKKYYGLTPKQYITDKRMAISRHCLQKGMTVAETCFAVGFECPNSFSTLFKSKTGFTPKEYQKSNFHKMP